MNNEKLRLNEVVIVEGRYDATVLASVIDALILPTHGFAIFKDEEKKQLIRRLGKQRGLLILTDSDAAGFKIRHYVQSIAQGCSIKHAYIPALPGKEKRKTSPSAEGTLGVEGMPVHLLLTALQQAGIQPQQANPNHSPITPANLYELGLSGRQNSAAVRRALLQKIGLPQRLSTHALCQVLSSLYTYQELEAVMRQKPPLFWDFHGTLSLPDIVWFDAAMEAAAELAPQHPLTREVLETALHGTCLPWFNIPSRDTRHVAGSAAWWAHCQKEFTAMFMQCGFTQSQAQLLAPALRGKVLQPQRYALYPDALNTLKELQRRGYESYILSNNYPELAPITDALGLTPYIKQVFVSGEIGYEKPRPEIFAVALQTVQPALQAWMIGDNMEDDITGGHSAGLVTVAVHGKRSPVADHQIDNLAEILELLP